MKPGNISQIKIFAVGGPAWGIPWFNCAPFPAKLETWLRLADLPYRGVNTISMRGAPKGKMPWLDDGDVVMGDSELIIAYLSKKHGVDLDASLSAEQRAHMRAYSALLEEHYHQVWEYLTFVGPRNAEASEEVFQLFPALMRPIGRVALRRSLRKQLYARGIGRHAHAEIEEMGIHDLDAVSALLGDKPFFFGQEPTTFDATAFAFIGLTLAQPVLSRVHEHAHELSSLRSYCDRMKSRVFGENATADEAIAA